MRIFTKIKGELVVYDTDAEDIEVAVNLVKEELGPEHKETILVLVKY